jgi:diguanylate cyclase (GGDEF)-like protein
MYFYQGTGATMQHALMRASLPAALINFLTISLGFEMLIYWALVHKRTQIGNALLYIGIFAILLGAWSALETDFAQLIITNRVACSFCTFVFLMMMSIPFMLFFHDYLQDDNPYLCPILCGLSLAQILVSITLQFAGIADLRDMLKATHIMLAIAILYFIITLFRTFRRRKQLRQIRISAVCMLVLIIAFVADLVVYYNQTDDADSLGRVAFFLFVMILGIDVSGISMRELEAGRKAMIYKELAEKDMLTQCYNRNAYLNDTLPEKLHDGLLLVTFDLNNLKYYNDTFGHGCGDQYLIDSVTIMLKVFEPLGKLYRIGGDEFCVLIEPDVPCDIERVMADFEQEEKKYNELADQIHLQVACGYAYYKAGQDADLEVTRERADILMYENKRALKGCEPR